MVSSWERFRLLVSVDCLAPHSLRRTCTTTTTPKTQFSTNFQLVFFGIFSPLKPGILLTYQFRLLDTLHLALVVHAIYFYNVTEYGNLLALQSIPLSLKVINSSLPIHIAPDQQRSSYRASSTLWSFSLYTRGFKILFTSENSNTSHPDCTLIVCGCVSNLLFSG